MPDIVVLVFTANEQSLEDGLRVISAAQRARMAFGYERSLLTVIPLLSRWEGATEVDLGQEWLARMEGKLTPLTDMWLPAQFSPRQLMDRLRVRHVARFAFGEPLPVLSHSLTDPELPGAAFDLLARLLASSFKNLERILNPDREGDATGQAASLALLQAAQDGDLNVVRSLLDDRADPNYSAGSGDEFTALMRAAVSGHEQIARLLLRHGANPNYVTREKGVTALTVAALNGHVDVLDLLIESGVPLDQAAHDGSTPLISAARRGHEVIVARLLAAGAALTPSDSQGTALDAAVANNHFGIVAKLRSVDAQCISGESIGQYLAPWPPRTFDRLSWTPASPEEGRQYADDFRSFGAPVEKERVRKLAIEINPGASLVIGPLAEQSGHACIMYSPGMVAPLRMESAAIYCGIDSVRSDTPPSELMQFVRIFLGLLMGQDKLFELVESIDDVRWKSSAEAKVREQVEGAIAPLKYVKFEDDRHYLSATVIYDRGLFRAVFTVDLKGSVAMAEDEPLNADLPVEAIVRRRQPLSLDAMRPEGR
jgi:hypothetical protein